MSAKFFSNFLGSKLGSETMTTGKKRLFSGFLALFFGVRRRRLIEFKPTNNQFHEEKEFIMELTRKILKPEWERAKQEAKGQRR